MIFPREVRAVVFDMDGLIFDTEVLYRDVHMAVADEAGHGMTMEFFLTMIGTTAETASVKYREYYGQDFDYEGFAARVSERFHHAAEKELRLKPGVVELLDALDAAGMPRAIATSSSRRTAEKHLPRHGLLERFQAIVTKGDYARGKPSPDPYLKAAERLGVDPKSCMALEDSHNGVRSASSAGMMTIMVPDLLVATEEMKRLCVYIAKDLHEVKSLLFSGQES